jgi:hypothetical protein
MEGDLVSHLLEQRQRHVDDVRACVRQASDRGVERAAGGLVAVPGTGVGHR